MHEFFECALLNNLVCLVRIELDARSSQANCSALQESQEDQLLFGTVLMDRNRDYHSSSTKRKEKGREGEEEERAFLFLSLRCPAKTTKTETIVIHTTMLSLADD